LVISLVASETSFPTAAVHTANQFGRVFSFDTMVKSDIVECGEFICYPYPVECVLGAYLLREANYRYSISYCAGGEVTGSTI
jgi:hypothetical protein